MVNISAKTLSRPSELWNRTPPDYYMSWVWVQRGHCDGVPGDVMTSVVSWYQSLSPIPNTLYRCTRLYQRINVIPRNVFPINSLSFVHLEGICWNPNYLLETDLVPGPQISWNCESFVIPGLNVSYPVCCLLWIDKSRVQDKMYIWVSVWWKTTN
jgi:hypothetical protein